MVVESEELWSKGLNVVDRDRRLPLDSYINLQMRGPNLSCAAIYAHMDADTLVVAPLE